MIGTHTLSRLYRALAVAMFLVALTAPAALAGPKYSVNYPWFNYTTSASETPGYRFITDTLAPGGGLVTSTPAAHGFDWSDAGIGAAITAGLMLILIGAARRLLSNRRSVVAV